MAMTTMVEKSPYLRNDFLVAPPFLGHSTNLEMGGEHRGSYSRADALL